MYYFPLLKNNELQLYSLSLKVILSVDHEPISVNECYLSYYPERDRTCTIGYQEMKNLPWDVFYRLAKNTKDAYFLMATNKSYSIKTPSIITSRNFSSISSSTLYYHLLYHLLDPTSKDEVLDLDRLVDRNGAFKELLDQFDQKGFRYLKEDSDKVLLPSFIEAHLEKTIPVMEVQDKTKKIRYFCSDDDWNPYLSVAKRNNDLVEGFNPQKESKMPYEKRV